MTRTLPSRVRPVPPPGFRPVVCMQNHVVHQPPQPRLQPQPFQPHHHHQQQQPPPYYPYANNYDHHVQQHHHHQQSVFYSSRPRGYNTYQTLPPSPVKFYKAKPQISFKVASAVTSNVAVVANMTTSSSSSSSSSTSSPNSVSVTMRRPPSRASSTAPMASASVAASTVASNPQNKRNAVYIKEVTPDNTKGAKPPLPMPGENQVPKPPPRSRPKSWTSTLFNAMRNNHRSVTFQCVDEERNTMTSSSCSVASSSEVIVASDPTMPLAAASSFDGQKFYSLPRASNSCNKLTSRSRTPSPFRSMIKGLMKGG